MLDEFGAFISEGDKGRHVWRNGAGDEATSWLALLTGLGRSVFFGSPSVPRGEERRLNILKR